MMAYLGAIHNFFLAQPYLVLAVLFLIAYGVKRRGSQRGPKAPMVPHLLPWVGSALEMGKDPDAFFENVISKLGPIFRVKAVGQTVTYVTSPEVISAIYRDAKTFEFTPIRLEMSYKVFGISFAATYSSLMTDQFFPMHQRGLSPKNLTGLLERYTANAVEDILQAVGQFEDKRTPLVPFLVLPAYTSVAHTFFGHAFDAKNSFDLFRRFDSYFHLLLAGVPRFMMPGPHRAWDKIGVMFENFLQKPHEDCCEFMLNLEDAARDGGWSVQDIARSMSSDLWAMEANATWAAYWTVALQLQQPEGLAPLITEVDLSRKEWTARNPGEPLRANLHRWLSSAALPRLTSTIQETLRLSTSTFSIRRVSQPTVFEGFHFEAGERIICATRAVHMDEQIHARAREFVPDRYLDTEKKLTKNGAVVPNHSMPFGGGVSMCEGRHFALAEIKIFTALLLWYATIELDPESSERPKYYTERIGVGLLPPMGDLNVHISRRKYVD